MNPDVTFDADGLTLRRLLEMLVRRADERLVIGERGAVLHVTTRDEWISSLNNYTTPACRSRRP
jgi:hypothetical protein